MPGGKSPQYLKSIVCLANSRKMSGRCIAGMVFKDGQIGEWVRPVSAREHQEISEEERRYADGTTAQLLDVVSIAMLRAAPSGYQRENHVIDDGFHWRKDGVVPAADLVRAVDRRSPSLWVNGVHSYNGLNDRVPLDQATLLTDSLRLIQIDGMSVMATAEGAAFGNHKLKARATFTWNGVQYRIVVTDPIVERAAMATPDVQVRYERVFGCVSLGEPHQGFAYKLLASVIM